ncbi:hypothetical protein BC835DRAFT_1002021 [Cytidiella melzeri]|nr:hypothetical protein BC835DRAFT_1002021 [Cytidiella melzeri]
MSSSGIFTTLFSTSVVTNSDGSESTSVIAIPTVLPYPSSSPASSSMRTIIIGSSLGGLALVIIIVSLFIFLHRSKKVRLNYKKLRVFGRLRKNLLDDEDDDWTDGEVHGLAPYRDRPTSSTASSSGRLRMAREGSSASATPFEVEAMLAEPPVRPAPSPYLLGMRAASSGSVFHEQGVWPPPSERSRLIDPLVEGSEQVELGNIVDNVMGTGTGPDNVAAKPPSSRYAHSTMSSHGSSSHYPPTTTAHGLSQSLSQRRPAAATPPDALTARWEMARAQSPDSELYDLHSTVPGGLSVRNADPTTPTEATAPSTSPPVPLLLPPPYSSNPDVSSETVGSNWLERAPRRSEND